uniref:G-protein coupled receptors family 3 profile domain-containing protein n=1 Tax=Leptocylindrus danicus TaxID=163516 RepID=A0A7S2KNJ2_9STRA|mmetsp:Transcript_2418/g.3541  ORF Transcript_2418/g.3541 Transcript_2418/m.3541 type:complete len:800 (+) Transcript_2418:76-2475(+)
MIRSTGVLCAVIAAVLVPGAAASGPIVNVERRVLQEGQNHHVHGNNGCDWTKNSPTIVIAQPVPLNSTDRFFSIGQNQLRAVEMMVDHINQWPRCGVQVGPERYSITLRTFGDSSDTKQMENLVQHSSFLDSDFFLGPYSSDLTKVLAEAAQNNSKLLLSGGAAATSVFQNRDHVFGILPPATNYLNRTVELLSQLEGVDSVGIVFERSLFAMEVCSAVPTLAGKYNMDASRMHGVASDIELRSAAESFSYYNPDVVLACMYDDGCRKWNRAMRNATWSPKLQVFTVCIGMEEISNEIDFQFNVGASPWNNGVTFEDNVTAWTPKEFTALFLDYTRQSVVTYHAAFAASALSVLVQAIEKAGSLDTSKVREILVKNKFPTIVGAIMFDENGQSNEFSPFAVQQYNDSMKLAMLDMESIGNDKLVFPAPTWGARDCIHTSNCTKSGGTCSISSGACLCSQSYQTSSGYGSTAHCSATNPDLLLIGKSVHYVGNIFISIQTILSGGALAWTWIHRNTHIVRLSQPVFLAMIAVGCFIIACSIIPIGVEDHTAGGHRRSKSSVDTACASVPWLYGLGFIVVYSALLAKIRRVQLIVLNDDLRRKKVSAGDMASLIAALVATELFLLLLWQSLAPLRWRRSPVAWNENGEVTQSKGYCESSPRFDTGIFNSLEIGLYTIFNACCLCYALRLSYFAWRYIPNELAEGIWIIASIVSFAQSILITVPILYIARSDNATETYYFVKTCICFIQSSTVTCFMFLPKMHRFHTYGDVNVQDVVLDTVHNITNRDSTGRMSRNRGSTGS